MLVTSLQTLALSSAFLAGLTLIGYPVKRLVERSGVTFPAPALLPGMALLFVVSWYWLDVGGRGLAPPTVACLLLGAGFLLFDSRRRGRAVLSFDADRTKLCGASFVIAILLIVLNWSTALDLPHVTTATTGNSDAISYVISAEHLAENNFSDPGPITGYDLGQRATRDAFSSEVLIGSFGAVTTLGAWKVGNSVLYAMIGLSTYTLALTIDMSLSRRRWLFSALVAGSANATLLFVYVQVSWFLGQVIAMAVTPLAAMVVLGERAAGRRADFISPVVIAVSVFLVLLSHYAHMAIAGPAIVALAATTTALASRGLRSAFRSAARSALVLLGCAAVACAIVPAWLVNGIRQTREYQGIEAGWLLPGFVPAELFGFTRSVLPEPSVARWLWSIVALGIFGLGAVWLRKREPRLCLFAVSAAVFVLGSYAAVFLKEGPGYQQWKWVTFFQPLLVASVVAVVALAIEPSLRRVHPRAGAPIAVLAFGLVVSTNTGDGSGTALRDRRQFVYASKDHWLLGQSPALRGLAEVNIDLGPFGDTMWAAYFLRDKKLYLVQPSYYPQSAPQARWTLVPAVGTLSGESVTPIGGKFRLLDTSERPTFSDRDVGLGGSIEVDIEHKPDGVVRAHATIVNEGTASWLPSETEDGGVKLAVQLADESGQLLEQDWVRLPIVAGRTFAIPPRTVVDIDFELPALTAGSYRLIFDLVSERVGWFDNSVTVPLTIGNGTPR